MYDINFYIKDMYKSTIYELASANAIDLTKSPNSKGIKLSLKSNCLRPQTENFYLQLFDRIKKSNKKLEYEIGYLYVLCDCLKSGPKVIFPTFKECLALENIEINVPYSEYQQPYSTVLIEFPEEYQKYYQNKTGCNPPKAVIAHYDNKTKFAYFSFIHKNKDFYDVGCFLNLSNVEKTIEEILNEGFSDSKDIDILNIKLTERLILNINLIMVNKGSVSRGFLDHKFRLQTARNKPKDLEVLDFAQKIFRQETISYQSATIGSHDSPKPHWRKGHFRRQHHGKNNLLIKTIFIEPVFVCYNPDIDLGNTSVEYA